MEPTFDQKVEKEAYLLIKRHGKEKAIDVCEKEISEMDDRINNLKFYDKDIVQANINSKFYWGSVIINILKNF
jgi:hypothetical protein